MNPISFALAHSLPEVVLAVGALALLMLGVFRARDGRDWIISECAIAVLGIAFLLLFFGIGPKALAWDGAFIDDTFGRFMKGLSLIGSIVTLLLSHDYMRREKIDLFEFPVLVIIATLGGNKAQVPAGEILRRRLTLTGSALRSRPVAFKSAIAAALLTHVWPLLARRIIAPVVDQVFALEDAALAHARMESGAHIGKIILQVR